jgi:DNA-directed RNA polymerase subunit RPC12/RpoP
MDTSRMTYPFGRCAGCGKEFNSELRDEYEITHCPWCGERIDDIFSITDSITEKIRENDIFCEDCGTRIYERTGKDLEGGNWIEGPDNEQPGVCSGPCERELCGNCADWDINGECEKCRTSPCGQCPTHDVVEICQKCKHLPERKKWSDYEKPDDMDGECNVCPKKCSDTKDCNNPCVDCPLRDDCLTDETDVRNQCTEFNNFSGEEIAGKTK